MAQTFDVVVIGGGPGGYVAAIRASQLKYKTAVVEKARLGGICLNWGCIPTKALLKNAEIFDKLSHGDEWGVKVDGLKYDFDKIISRSRGVADKMSKGIDILMKKNKVTPIAGTAKILGPNKVEVTNEDGKKETIEAKHIIISTGARPKSLPGVKIDGKSVLSSKEAMSLAKAPKSMTIVGAGAIGMEFAYFYAVIGTKVTVLEYADTVLPVEDRDMSKVVASSFKKRGINIITKAAVKGVEVTKNGTVTTYEKGGKTEKVESEKTLMAIGVTGNIENLGLEELKVEIFKEHIKVDDHYRTNVKGLYAIGDVIGPPWLAHVASAEAIHCVEAIAGMDPTPIDYSNIPGCTYCQPQVASVGLTEAKCKEQGLEYKVGKFPFTASGKAVAGSEPDGMVKLIFGKKYGEILGGHIVGSEATEMIAEVCLARRLEATMEDLHTTIHAHPTLSEAIMEAAAAADEMAIHI
ncbi:MAG: dihydrolipoyl dehydrogenase [Candidatus Sumerlaeia bacterium]|nr:dihydrolipoyl dehydrogenase [Candidatus Sumerlaeia bacterium]